MANRIIKKTELLAHIAIIIVALLLSVVLVKSYIWPDSEVAPTRSLDPHTPIGSKATLANVE